MGLLSHLLQTLELFLFILFEFLNLRPVSLIPPVIQLIEDLAFVQNHGLSVALLLFPLCRLGVLVTVLLQLHSLSKSLLVFFLGFVFLSGECSLILITVVVQLVLMVLHSLDLRVENELLSNNFQSTLCLILCPLLKSFSHVHVLFFEQLNVLMRSLLIVKERADS